MHENRRRTRPIVAILAGLIALTTFTVAPAIAITDGTPDGDGHPYVGLMVAQAEDGTPLWRCSGTLISPTLYLTAGHCTEAPAAHVEIWFTPDARDAAAINYPFVGDVGGTPYTHPDYDPNRFFYRDLGMVVLDEPMVMSGYGALPALNRLDALKTRRGVQDVTFTAVGYGLQMSFPDAASWKEHNVRVRMVAHPKLNQINVPGFTGNYSLLLSNNANTGGTCFGDSGGPNFIGMSNVLGGVTSFGVNGNCAGTGGVFRVDRSWSLDWIHSFMD
jgi:hypothetical protein